MFKGTVPTMLHNSKPYVDLYTNVWYFDTCVISQLGRTLPCTGRCSKNDIVIMHDKEQMERGTASRR